MILRSYQADLRARVRDALRTTPRVLMSLPTGGGKTVIAASMLEAAAAKGHRCLFLAHRRELIHQASARLGSVPHGLILAGEKPTDAPVQVASVQTIVRRDAGHFDFVFIDEAHHTAADSYQRILERTSPRWVVGLTATPYRTDGRGLGDTYGALVAGPSTLDLTEQGYLAPVDLYSAPLAAMLGATVRAGDYTAEELEERINRPRLVGDVVRTWMKHPPSRTVVFAVSVAHAEALEAEFTSAGVRSAVVVGDTPDRGALLADPAITVLCTCGVLQEGWDDPSCVCAVVARPTLSRGLWRQMVGRVLRTHPGKARALVLDHGGNAVRHGHIYAPDPATLEQSAHRPRDTDAPATSVCPTCFGVYWRTEDRVCPYCGVERPAKEREIRRVEGDLERVDWSAAPLAKHDDTKATAAARALAERARERGYALGWLFWQLKLRYGVDRARTLIREVAA